MSLDLHDYESIDEKTLHMVDEIKVLLKAAGSERLSDMIMTMATFQLQTEITFAGKEDIASVNDFWIELSGRLLLLMKEQNERGIFPDRRH